MNDELEDKDLAELLKQIPAPAHLEPERRAAIFAALPKDEDVGRRSRRSRSTMLALVVSFAATITLMVLFGGLLIPNFLTKRSFESRCVNIPVPCEIALPDSSVDFSVDVEEPCSYASASVAAPAKPQASEVFYRRRPSSAPRASAVALEQEATKALDEPALVAGRSAFGVNRADGVENFSKRKESGLPFAGGAMAPSAETKPTGSVNLYGSRSASQSPAAREDVKMARDATAGKALGIGTLTESSSSDFDVPQAGVVASPASTPPPPMSPVMMSSSPLTKSPIIMKGIVAARPPKPRAGKALRYAEGVDTGVPSDDGRGAGETLNRDSVALREKNISGEIAAESQKADMAFKLGDEKLSARRLREVKNNRILGIQNGGRDEALAMQKPEQQLAAKSAEQKQEEVVGYDYAAGDVSDQKDGDVQVVSLATDSQAHEVLQQMKSSPTRASELDEKSRAASKSDAIDPMMKMACQEVAEDKAENGAPISEFATLENARRQLFDERGRDMLKEGQAALRDRKPDVALKKFQEARNFLVEKEENREAIEQAKAGIKEAFYFGGLQGAAVPESLLQEESSKITLADEELDVQEDAFVKRMKSIVIPEVDFQQATVPDIVNFLGDASREFDVASMPIERRGVNIVWNSSKPAESLPPITMNAKDVSLMDALDLVAERLNLIWRIRDDIIFFMDDVAPTGSLAYKMFPEVADLLPESAKANVEGEVDVYKDTKASKAAKAFFKELGVEWPTGSTCRYNPDIQALLVRNTLENLKALEVALSKLKEQAAPPASVDFAPFSLIPTVEHPLSTFGLDTDTAGYLRSAALIDAGVRPEPSMIRQEEFINAFEYGDEAPSEAAFRIYLEGAYSPFRPENNLLRVGIKGRRLGREEQRPLMLTILLDASGSMETHERMGLAQKAILALLTKLSARDNVVLLTCSDKTREIFTMTGWGTESVLESAQKALDEIRCQGATDLEDGIIKAYEKAAASFDPQGENRIVILSDGIANLGNVNSEDILTKVSVFRGRGIRCSVIGVGHSTYNDKFLEAMANRGDGQYNFLDSEKSINENFVNDLENSFNTIASDVKIQVEWNPKAIDAYRSHGYDSRALKDEEFRDDTVDAGEVGSGQGVSVVYEMKLMEKLKPTDILGTVHIRYRRTDTGEVEEIEKAITVENVSKVFDQMRPSFRLACAVAEFATVLKHTPPEAQGQALAKVELTAELVAQEMNYYTPAKAFADTVKKLMGIGL